MLFLLYHVQDVVGSNFKTFQEFIYRNSVISIREEFKNMFELSDCYSIHLISHQERKKVQQKSAGLASNEKVHQSSHGLYMNPCEIDDCIDSKCPPWNLCLSFCLYPSCPSALPHWGGL